MGFYYSLLIFFALISLIGVKSKKQENFMQIIFIVIIAIVAGARDGVGTDFESYELIFDLAPELSEIFNQVSQIEPLFWFLCSVIKTLGGDTAVMFFLTSIITSVVLVKASKRILPKYYIVSFLIYFCFFLFRFQFNTIRHGMMVSFVWLAFSYIPERNFKKFLFYIVMGAGFHILGLLFIPFYWLLNVNFRKHTYILLLLFSVILGLFLNPFDFLLRILPKSNVFYEKFQFYTKGYYENQNSALGVTLGMIVYSIFLFFLLLKRDFLKRYKYGLMLLNTLFYALFFAFLMNKYGVFVERITSLFYVSLIYLISFLFYKFPMKYSTRVIVSLFFVLYITLLFTKNVTGKERDGSYQYLPYKTII